MVKKVIKKALKKVPGPIGSVARVGSIARKLSNAAKNAKNLKPLRKGVGFPKATKKQMKSFKKAMDLKSPALKKVYEANRKANKVKPATAKESSFGRYPTKKQKTAVKKAGTNIKAEGNEKFTGSIKVGGKKLNNSQVMKRATRTTTREKRINKRENRSAKKYVKEMDAKVEKAGIKKLAKRGYSLKDLEY